MSETLTIFGINYPDTEGFKVKDDLGTTHTYGEGGGTVEDKFITVTFNNHLETGGITLHYVTGANLVNSSSGYVEMVSTTSIPHDSSVTKLMPYGFGLAVRTSSLGSGNAQNFNVQMNNTVIDPYIEGKYGTSYYKYYRISKTNLDSSNNVIDFYSTSDPFKDTVVTDTLSVTVNDTYTAPLGTAYSEVTVNVPSSSPTLQTITKTYTPTESQQTEQITADSGYDAIEEVDVTVNAIPSTYVGSGISRRTNSDLTIEDIGNLIAVNVPGGYYDRYYYKEIPSGTAGTPIATKGTVSNHAISVTPSVTNSPGYIFGGTITGTAVSVSASELDSGTKQITQNGQGIDVVGYASVDVNVSTPALNLQSKTATPTESVQTITPDSGYDGLSNVEVGAISSTYVGSGITRRTSQDIDAGQVAGEYMVSVPSGYYQSSATVYVPGGSVTALATKGTVSNHSISITPSATRTAGYVQSGSVNGTAVSVSASELVSGTYTVDSSGTKDVTNYASASVPSGTAGTPTASKGTVSNHSVSVTPSVTNTTGFITGSTKTGTAVSVSASELVSGSETKTANGTYDVTNLASLVVAIPFSTITVSSSNPTGGNNGDVWIKTA